MQSKSEKESRVQVQLFIDALGVDDELAAILVNEGFTSIEEVAYVPVVELLEVEGFDEDLVSTLRERAKDYLLTKAIEREEKKETFTPDAKLLSLSGMSEDLAMALAEKGIHDQEMLAELGVDELMELVNISEQQASCLIMAARAPWFA
jgi:N utilization substance protein A